LENIRVFSFIDQGKSTLEFGNLKNITAVL